MSHFVVLVVGNNIEAQLAPFQESNSDTPREYLEFVDKEDEILEEYRAGSSPRVVMPDGSFVTPYDERFRKKGTFGYGSNTHEVPAHLEQRNIAFTALYPNVDAYAEEHHGYTGRDSVTHRYGYWENPNAKWDWYEVGGRWSGFFKLKPNVIGRPGFIALSTKPGYADSVRLCDIDIEGMRKAAEEEAAQRYDAFHRIVAGRLVPQFSDVLNAHQGQADAAREAYWSHPVIQDLTRANEFSGFEGFKVTREEYMQRAANATLAPHALLLNGSWHQRGQMGWFGVVSDKVENETWYEKLAELLMALPPETLLTAVDCHI